MLDARYREAAHDQIDRQKHRPRGIGSSVSEIEGYAERAPARAVAIPTRRPPNAGAKKTAGKYGVKKTSGRISERRYRTALARARQAAAKPMLKSGEGPGVPCRPRRNSSINFAMGHATSAEPRIQDKARP